MSKKWAEHSADEKTAVFEALAAVYEEAGHPAGLGQPGSDAEYVNIMIQKQYQEVVKPLVISGEFKPDQQELCESLNTKIKAAVANVADARVQLSVKLGVGSPMGVIKSVNKVLEDGECDVSHEEGQVLLLDFWATWCPPCQAPMAHNQKMLEEHEEKWGGKVRLIGLSIDQAAPTVKQHVESKGWTKVEHYHVRNGKCVADKEFGVQGVPHVAIVDTHGKIVFMGHPASRQNLEQDFDDLLAGKEITGAGTSPAGDDDEFTINVQAD